MEGLGIRESDEHRLTRETHEQEMLRLRMDAHLGEITTEDVCKALGINIGNIGRELNLTRKKEKEFDKDGNEIVMVHGRRAKKVKVLWGSQDHYLVFID